VTIWLGPSLVLATLVSEDAAMLSAGLLAAAGSISPLEAVCWTAFGVWAGDLGLFAAGRLTRSTGRVSRWMARRWGPDELARASARLRTHAALAIVASRFVPGSRLALYVAAGFVRVPTSLFAAVTLGATLAWTTLVVLSMVWAL
jgi:membrane protein DedA with SNARE-associated domain